jgi:hypothetical protein
MAVCIGALLKNVEEKKSIFCGFNFELPTIEFTKFLKLIYYFCLNLNNY